MSSSKYFNLLQQMLKKKKLVGSAFVPPPDVDVGVVRLRPKIKPIIDEDFSLVERVVRQMFTFRQKKCFRSAE